MFSSPLLTISKLIQSRTQLTRPSTSGWYYPSVPGGNGALSHCVIHIPICNTFTNKTDGLHITHGHNNNTVLIFQNLYKENFIHFLKIQDSSHSQQTITIPLERPQPGNMVMFTVNILPTSQHTFTFIITFTLVLSSPYEKSTKGFCCCH